MRDSEKFNRVERGPKPAGYALIAVEVSFLVSSQLASELFNSDHLSRRLAA